MLGFSEASQSGQMGSKPGVLLRKTYTRILALAARDTCVFVLAPAQNGPASFKQHVLKHHVRVDEAAACREQMMVYRTLVHCSSTPRAM